MEVLIVLIVMGGYTHVNILKMYPLIMCHLLYVNYASISSLKTYLEKKYIHNSNKYQRMQC